MGVGLRGLHFHRCPSGALLIEKAFVPEKEQSTICRMLKKLLFNYGTYFDT